MSQSDGLALSLKTKKSMHNLLDLRFKSAPELVYAFFDLKDNCVVVDARKLGELVDGMVRMAREVGVDLGDREDVWVCKFSSVVSGVTMNRALLEIEGAKAASGFSKLYLSAFMEKIPTNSIHVTLWSDAYETSYVGDTWFS